MKFFFKPKYSLFFFIPGYTLHCLGVWQLLLLVQKILLHRIDERIKIYVNKRNIKRKFSSVKKHRNKLPSVFYSANGNARLPHFLCRSLLLVLVCLRNLWLKSCSLLVCSKKINRNACLKEFWIISQWRHKIKSHWENCWRWPIFSLKFSEKKNSKHSLRAYMELTGSLVRCKYSQIRIVRRRQKWIIHSWLQVALKSQYLKPGSNRYIFLCAFVVIETNLYPSK